MQNTFLYIFVSIVWGLSWYLIKIQMNFVGPLWNAVYRFSFASLLLFLICLITKHSLKMSKKEHQFAAAMGLFMFCLNYTFYYIAAQHLISGLVAVIVASMSILNSINGYFFLKRHLSAKTVIGGLLGLFGVSLIFISSAKGFVLQGGTTHALIWGSLSALAGTYVASLGNMISSHSQSRQKTSLLVSNAFGMAYGSLYLLILALAGGEPFKLPWNATYLGSLFLIVVVATAMAFHFYLTLLRRIGPERVAYTFVVNPIIAMFVSMRFENMHISSITFLGLGIATLGNVVILMKTRVHPTFDTSKKADASTQSLLNTHEQR